MHDQLTANRKWVEDLCQQFVKSGLSERVRWSCSGRVDRIDGELIGQLAEAGCHRIFLGIESGSQQIQKIIKKGLDTEKIKPAIRDCLEHKIGVTASFITGFPGETRQEMLKTLSMAMDIVQMSPATHAQIHTLSPHIGTALYEEHRKELTLDPHGSDASLFLPTLEEETLIKKHPEVFASFYHIPNCSMSRDLLNAVSWTVYGCFSLLLLLRHAGLDLGQFFDEWVPWRDENIGSAWYEEPDYYVGRLD